MINDKKLTQQGAEGSNNYQAGHNLNMTGFNKDEVAELITIVSTESIKTLVSELSGKGLLSAMAKKEEAQTEIVNMIVQDAECLKLVKRFEEPAIQIALSSVYKEYIKTNDAELGRSLIDLMLDRLRVDDITVEQFLIDEAIHILPKLTKIQLDFITAYVFSKFITLPKNYDDFIRIHQSLGVIADSLENVQQIDFDYLKHLSLFQSTQGLSFDYKLYDHLRQNYKCILTNGVDINPYLAKNQELATLLSMQLFFRIPNNNCSLTISALNDSGLEQIIQENKLEKFRKELVEIFNSNLMSDAEIKDLFIGIKKEWAYFFTLFTENKKIKELQPSQLAYYIGLKQIGRLLNENISLDILYK